MSARWTLISYRAWLAGLSLSAGLFGVQACELAPHDTPQVPPGEAGAAAEGGNDPGGGLMPVDGAGGDDPPPCGGVFDSGAFVSQTDFAASGQERLDAAFVGDDGAAWIALGYDDAFEVGGEMLEAPIDRDVMLLRVAEGESGDLHRIHGVGDQQIDLMTYDGALHVVGTVTGPSVELIVDGVSYPSFESGDTFYLNIQGDLTSVYRLRGGVIDPTAISIDDFGHPWIVGNFSGSLTLSGTPNAGGLAGNIVSVDGESPNLNGFATRLAPGAERLTAIGPPSGEGTSDDETRIAGVVPFNEDGGEMVVFGDFRGRLALGSGLYDVEGESDLWLARIEPTGDVSDRARYNAPGAAEAAAFLLTPGGQGIIVGTYSGDLGWMDPPHGVTGMFISQVKLRDLKRGRARAFSAPTGELHPTSLARYPFGNGIIIAGQLTGEAFPLVGDIATNTDGVPDAFVLALENDLDDRYAWHIEASTPASIRDVATAPCQAAAIVGSLEDGAVTARRLSSDDDPVSFTDAAAMDAFLLRLSY